ncbi:ABC transporter permease [Bacillus nakamurai]|uniref:ABC transporter permease n=1 Tax=Bacillus nakamurai TaxID=1793963 RepID=A0A150FBY7_9BACI|nr:ABC transporter permease [Bacillus nakamurai]KXZ20276.1 ABC transporter permease [Bacillus nakamurai]KXZ23237.1 ABC transporter permease [Bacillus nakamurai]MED1227988.1 ABC transporter permease [Bacillus nakamurai]
MTGRALFFHRLFEYWRYQWRVFRTVIDWTVALYIVLPAAGFLVYQYSEWLKGKGLLFEGAEILGWGWFYVFSALLLCTGSIHTFLLEADQVFLMQTKYLMVQLKRYALLYSVFISCMKWLLLAVLLYPLWRQYSDSSLAAYAGIFIFLFSLHTAVMAVNDKRKRKRQTLVNQMTGWMPAAGLIALSLVFIGFAEWYWLWPLGCISFVCSVISCLKETESLSAFAEEVLKEKKRKLSFAAAVMMLSQDVHLPNVKDKRRSKPLFYPHSKPLFKKRSAFTAWKELFFKVLIRNSEYVRQLYLFMAAFTALIVVLPIWMKLIVFVLFTGVNRYVLSLLFDRIMDKAILSGIDKESDDYFRARKSALNTVQFVCAGWCLIAAVLSAVYM